MVVGRREDEKTRERNEEMRDADGRLTSVTGYWLTASASVLRFQLTKRVSNLPYRYLYIASLERALSRD
jgi:hypothetical protein